MTDYENYLRLVKNLTSRPAKIEPYSEKDTTEMFVKIITALTAGGLTLTAIASFLAPYL